MPDKKTPLMCSFNAGEITPEMDARSDVDKYGQGCRVLENAIPTVPGGVIRAPGTKFVREAGGIGWWTTYLTPRHMILDGSNVYIVGSRIVNLVRTQCIIKYSLDGLNLRLMTYVDHDVGEYWAVSVFGDYLYASGYRTVSGVDPAVHRKLKKDDLSIVWTREIYTGTDNCFSRVAAILEGGFVYTGNFVGGVGGHLLKLNDSNGSIARVILSSHSPGSVHLHSIYVDYAGCYSGTRRISRRLKSDLSLVSNHDFAGEGFNFGKGPVGDFYYLVSRHVIGANDYCAVTKVDKETLAQVWNTDVNMSPGAFTFEQLTGIAMEGTTSYSVGRTYSGVPANDRGIIIRMDEDGGNVVSYLYTSARAILAAVFSSPDYLCVGTYDTTGVLAGHFEWRSKTDLSLVQERAL